MFEMVQLEGAGHYYFYAYPVAIILLFIFMKGRRIRFLLPSLLITVIIVNPWFYEIWTKLGHYGYWRILWVPPLIPVVAALPSVVSEYINKKWLKYLTGVVFVVLFGFLGSFIYTTSKPIPFRIPAENSSKLPNYVVKVADKLLEMKDRPRIIAQYPVGILLRTYSGKIDQLFGRDIDGYIYSPSSLAISIDQAIEDKDYAKISQAMLDDGYDYLILNDENTAVETEYLKLVERADQYGIYEAIGKPHVIKERNELGQVISVSSVDENGNIINGENGYATIWYEYDNNCFISREYRTDVNGKGVLNAEGFAGYAQEFDMYGHCIAYRALGEDGTPVSNKQGYAEWRREYRGHDIVQESYYDNEGTPVNRKDVLYSSVHYSYDRNHNRTEEYYYNKEGKLFMLPAGYAGMKRSYDQNSRVASVSYLNTDGKPVDIINGYAREEREYDQSGNVVLQRYFDSNDQPVLTAAGYHEVHRVYNDSQKLLREEYYDTEGKPFVQAAGYAAIEQIWEGERLVSRIYLDSDGKPVMRTDGYAKANWSFDENGYSEVYFEDLDGNKVAPEGKNLAKDIHFGPDGWSEWMTPNPNTINYCFNIGYANLGIKTEGDVYTFQMEIEFKNVSSQSVQSFRFWAQGLQDGRWFTDNVWDGNLINLQGVPADGVYKVTSNKTVSGDMVHVSTFDIGFRCDDWASGSFRVRNVKIEKGNIPTEWTPGI